MRSPAAHSPRWTACCAAAACLLAIALASLAGASPVVNATLEPTEVALGESAQLTITSSGNGMDDVRLPDVPGLQFRVVGQSRRISIINGATLITSSITVRVTPDQPGVFTIPGIPGNAPPMVLRVNPAGSGPAPGASGSPGLWGPPGSLGHGRGGLDASGIQMTTDGSAFVRLVLPKRDIYVGESIPVDIEVGLRDGFVSSLNGLPTLTGGDFTLNNLSHQPERVQKIIDGKPFTVLSWHSIIAAVKPGKFSLAAESPLTVRVRLRPSRESLLEDLLGDPFLQNYFGATVPKEITVASPVTELTVLELPAAGRPADFSGAVGTFKMTTELSTATAAAGDPLTLRMHIAGTGNFDRVESGMLQPAEPWKTYPPKASFKPSDGLGNKGDKVFEQPLIATKTGPQVVPPLAFSYFDPNAKRYVTARSAPLDVTITPAAADVAAAAAARTPALAANSAGNGTPPAAAAATPTPGAGWRPDHVATEVPVDTLVPLYLQPRFLAVPSALALAFVGGWLALQRRATGSIAARRRGPQRTARLLDDLDAAAHAGDTAAFFELARCALQHARPDDEEARRIIALADEAKFSGHAPSRADFARWADTVHRLLENTPPTAREQRA